MGGSGEKTKRFILPQLTVQGERQIGNGIAPGKETYYDTRQEIKAQPDYKGQRMRIMQSQAPAKINVYLRIVGRRPDGYHLLDSLMVPINLYDDIHITVAHGEQRATHSGAVLVVHCDDPAVPSGETNLAYKAAALVCQEAGLQVRIDINLRKRIPAGAGLGGGSSNAATVLKSLNALLALGWTEARLCQLGVRLGADVPFFIACRPAHIGGIGDIVTTIPPLPACSVVLVVPPFGVSTLWAYGRFDELPPAAPSSVQPWHFTPGQWPSRELLINDLERAVLPAYPPIAALKDALLRLGAEGVLMSGSGSSVFGIFRHRTAAEQAVPPLQTHGRVFLVEPLPGPPGAV
jgi:4-diphosphocytidyl-2-C-methyl-D-erythritol kinase